MNSEPSSTEAVALGCAVVAACCLLFWAAVFTAVLCLVRV